MKKTVTFHFLKPFLLSVLDVDLLCIPSVTRFYGLIFRSQFLRMRKEDEKNKLEVQKSLDIQKTERNS